MWHELTRWLASFDSAVIVWRDAEGYPTSARCHPVPDPARQALGITPAPGDRFRVGPAGLLCHSHDRETWNLRSFHVSGELHQDDAGWWFVPTRLIPGTGLTGIRGNIAWLRGSSREARDYLRARGLTRPRIDWAEIDAAKKEGAALFEQARRARE
jgi:hypothetical protein